jgi:hypothetical protein
MLNESKIGGVALGSAEGPRSTTGRASSAAAEVKRWSAGRKKEVVLRLSRSEPVESISRAVVPAWARRRGKRPVLRVPGKESPAAGRGWLVSAAA